ncbi:MAG TPA: PilN domain-containing protein [Steroidobacteraceae bacterium]|jgi:type IV pilus assembly protein PilN|nr:PilN domain-containing protein [Steroidobacteraceae bacterium]
MPRINLLPWRDQQRRERRVGFYLALGGAAAAAAVAAFATYLMFSSMIDGQDARNARLRAEIRLVDKQIEEINDLETQKQNFISRMQIIEKLQRSRPEVVHLFDQLVKVMPDGTYLTSVKQSGDQLKLEGIAQSSTRVSTLMRNIASSQWLRNPELEVIETKKDNVPGSRFVLDAQQVSLSDADDDDSGSSGSGSSAAVKRSARPAVTGLTR